MNVGSLFTGIGGFDLGLERAGMRVVFQCEADPWRRGILAQHWPGVPCYPDVRAVAGGDRLCDGQRDSASVESGERSLAAVDLLCGGFPCQDLSVAGQRAGLAGARSGLFFEFARIADELVRSGGWVLVENVPGLLTSAGGRDFAVVIRTLGDIGFHDLAWRVLDSRYFGVPQRRRRVFIVGRRAAGRGAREVLLEPESGGGNFATGREARSRVAASLSRGSSAAGVSAPGRRQEDDENIVNALDRQRGGADDNSAQAGHLVANTLKAHAGRGGSGIGPEHNFVAGTIRSHMRPGSNSVDCVIAPAIVKRYGKGTDSDATDALIAHTLRAEGFDASEDGTGRGTPLVAGVQGSRRGKQARAGDGRSGTQGESGERQSQPRPDEHGAASNPDRVRTLTGLPRWVDDPQPDGPRYAACGDAVTVKVLEWIGRRIMSYERLAA